MNARSPSSGHDTADAAPTLVLIHDTSSGPLEFGALAQILSAREVAFDFLEIPGYTLGAGRPAMAWRDWLAAAGELLDRRYPAGTSMVLGGLGAGAALAAALAVMQRPQRVVGVALLSPNFVNDGPAAPARSPLHRAASAARLDRWIAVAKRDPFGIKNPKTRKWVAREIAERGVSSIGLARVPLRVLRESRRLHAHVRDALRTLGAPLLVLHAVEDDVASLASVERLVAEWGDHARLIALEHSYRMITLDNDRQRVAHELADFIGAPKRKAVVPPAAPVRQPRARPARGIAVTAATI